MIMYLTFDRDHPLRDGWIEVEADDCLDAQKKSKKLFCGGVWCMYYKDDFHPEYFPAGKLGETIR